MSGRGSDYFEGSGADLLESSKFENIQALVKAFAKGTVEARDPDRGFPVIPINRLKKIGPRYKKLNTILIIVEKCSLKRIYLSDDKIYNWLPREFHDELRKIYVNPTNLPREDHQIFKINIPDIFFDYNKLIKAGITLNTEFDFVYLDIPLIKEDGIIKPKKSGHKQEIIKLKLTEMTPESIKWEFISDGNQKHWKYYRAFEDSFFKDTGIHHNKSHSCMQVEPEEKRQLMTRPAYRFSILPTITALPSWKLRAVLHINSRIKLSDIEKYFIFGEGDIRDRLLKSFNKYFNLKGEAFKTVNEKIAKFLQGKEPKILDTSSLDNPARVPVRKKLTKRWASELKLNAVENIAKKSLTSDSCESDKAKTEIDYIYSEKESLENELHSYLQVSITKKLDFLHEYMLEECVYEMDGNREDTPFIPFDCDLKSYTKKYFFPLSKDSEQEAEKNFEAFLKSLLYKKVFVDSMQNTSDYKPLTATDVTDDKNLAELRAFCQSLLRVYSKEELYYELREKNCPSFIAALLIYRRTQKNKNQKPEKNESDSFFGHKETTIRSEAHRLEEKYKKIAKPVITNIIAILADHNQS